MGSGNTATRFFGLALAVWIVAACAGTSTEPETGERGGFGDTPAPSTDDPGLGDRDAGHGGVDSSTRGLQTIYFAYDDHGLSAAARDLLRHNADVLGQGDRTVEVQGNCDERGTAEYNLALGKRRAESTRRYLLDLGVDAGLIKTVSFGEENPAVEGHNDTAWARNRRADFVLR